MTVEDLESEFAALGEVRGGTLWLPADAAVAMVRRARSARIPVLGIDAARLEPQRTVPDLAHTLDFAGAGCRTNPWSEAEAFLEDRADLGLSFEVVLDSVAPDR